MPLSPSIKTLAEEGATCRIVSSTSRSASDSPRIFSSPKRSSICCRKRAIFLLHPARLQRARDQHFNFVEIERLGHEIVGAAFHRLDRGIDRTVGRHHDANRRMRHFQRALDQLHAILAAEPQIGQQQVDLFRVPGRSIAPPMSSAT